MRGLAPERVGTKGDASDSTRTLGGGARLVEVEEKPAVAAERALVSPVRHKVLAPEVAGGPSRLATGRSVIPFARAVDSIVQLG